LIAFECLSLDFRKLLIPEEAFKSEQQKRYEAQNFKNANISPREWRIKKCYRNVSFEIFWKSKLCPGDIHTCVHSYAVEELQLFKNYRDYLLQISELCADGYVLDKQDRTFFKNSTQGEVDRFVEYVKKNRKKKINYDKPLEDQFDKSIKIQKYKEENLKNTGAHDAVPRPENSKNNIEDIEKDELQIKKREESLRNMEKKLILKKKLIEEEKIIIDQKKRLKELESKILESERQLREKKREME